MVAQNRRSLTAALISKFFIFFMKISLIKVLILVQKHRIKKPLVSTVCSWLVFHFFADDRFGVVFGVSWIIFYKLLISRISLVLYWLLCFIGTLLLISVVIRMTSGNPDILYLVTDEEKELEMLTFESIRT